MANRDSGKRRFWVVSPNVSNKPRIVPDWIKACLKYRAAFMGYWPDNKAHRRIGYKFAHVVKPGDILLIARRSRYRPQVVGMGVVDGKFKRRLKGFRKPHDFGSLRKLSPFRSLNSVPSSLVMPALGHTMALCRLHPGRNPEHKRLCEWMERRLGKRTGVNKNQSREPRKMKARLVRLTHADEPEYEFKTKRKVRLAEKREDDLVRRYESWLSDQGRELRVGEYGKLRCDAYEKKRRNLIEAKSSARRGQIRMAVGQLLDYSYLGRQQFGTPHMAVLLSEKPDQEIMRWLCSLHISVIWKEQDLFRDNAEGRFTEK